MNKTEVLHAILLCVGATALAAALAFLYDKTQAVDLREQNEILGFLRELKDIDGRWDLDVVRTHSELAAADLPATEPRGGRRQGARKLARGGATHAECGVQRGVAGAGRGDPAKKAGSSKNSGPKTAPRKPRCAMC